MTDLERVRAWITSAKSICVLTGSGVSAESGIPTFRGPNGLWRGRDPMTLATPEAFFADPQLVWTFYNDRRERLSTCSPNPAHLAIANLQKCATEFMLVTQNVDRLHQLAGSREVLELHGNIWDVRCTGCGVTFDRTGVLLAPLPMCPECGGLLRPAVVWFGENLPEATWSRAIDAISSCELMLVVGTSALVYPAAGLIGHAKRGGARVVEINIEPSAANHEIDLGLYGKAGEILPKLTDQLI